VPCSINSWYHQHTLGHHIFTNVNGVDPDVPAAKDGDIRRISSYQNWAPAYRFQHLYLPFLYGFLGFKFRIQVRKSARFCCREFFMALNGPLPSRLLLLGNGSSLAPNIQLSMSSPLC
jgi:hypothetical protein